MSEKSFSISMARRKCPRKALISQWLDGYVRKKALVCQWLDGNVRRFPKEPIVYEDTLSTSNALFRISAEGLRSSDKPVINFVNAYVIYFLSWYDWRKVIPVRLGFSLFKGLYGLF